MCRTELAGQGCDDGHTRVRLPLRRTLARAGDIPVDVFGRRSRVIAGDASHYSDVVSPVPLAG